MIVIFAGTLMANYVRVLMQDNSEQRATLAAVHEIFPEPVAYIDRCSMISRYNKVGFFMASWQIAEYLEKTYPSPSLFGGNPGLTQTFNVWVDRAVVPAMLPVVVADIHERVDPADRAYFRWPMFGRRPIYLFLGDARPDSKDSWMAECPTILAADRTDALEDQLKHLIGHTAAAQQQALVRDLLAIEIDAGDFNYDGRPETRLASNRLMLLVSPVEGGQIYELDVKTICHNLQATLTRRPEAYHRKVLKGPNQGGGEVASPASSETRAP